MVPHVIKCSAEERLVYTEGKKSHYEACIYVFCTSNLVAMHNNSWELGLIFVWKITVDAL